ncbi:MAG: hypothetical protein AAB865_00170 [Patescibacteria group bacterium]
MKHPHQAILDEFQYAIDHLVPTVPSGVAEEAKRLHHELSENPEATEAQIHDALVNIGKQEFPYRRAYQEMMEEPSEEKRTALVLDHLEPEVKVKVETVMKDGVTLEALTKSSIFETDFTSEERYQIEDGILHAADHVKEEMPEVIASNKGKYDGLVESWKEKQKTMEAKIEELRALAGKDDKWREEILDKVKTLEEGWSVVERDPELLEIEKEIEYWQGTMDVLE